MSGKEATKQNARKNHSNSSDTIHTCLTPSMYKTHNCCSAIDVANHFLLLAKADKGINFTPLLLEKTVILANAYCLEEGQFHLTDEELSKDKFGEFFPRLRSYLSFYSHNAIITECFSNLAPEADFLAKTKLGIECTLTKLDDHSLYLDPIYNYVKKQKLDWKDLSNQMGRHINDLVTDRGRCVNG